MHTSHNTMPDEFAISGSVVYPQERCSKRSREIGSGSWLGPTKYNVTGTLRAPQPWMSILVGGKRGVWLLEYYAVDDAQVKETCSHEVEELPDSVQETATRFDVFFVCN
jgi:hypothetical protein